MQEIENDQVVQGKMTEFDEIIDQEIQNSRELPSQKRQMSPRSRFLLRINGLIQQRGSIFLALISNEEAEAQGEKDLDAYIKWQNEEIIRYDMLIQKYLEHAEEMRYELKRNPKTGRYVISSRPDDTDIMPIKKLSDGINAFFEELITALNEESTQLDNELIRMQEEQIRMIQNKERKIIDTNEQFKKIETINDRINHVEKIQKDLIMFLHNY